MSFGAPVRNGIGIGLKASTSLSTRGGASGPPKGQQAYTTQGTYTWVAPAGVTSVCVVCVGGGSYKGAGGLGWKNDIVVVPGNSYSVRVGTASPFAGSNGQSSFFINDATVSGGGGVWQGSGGTYVGTGGGNGGGSSGTLGAGGAGGYTGNGAAAPSSYNANGSAGSGGGGGSGSLINDSGVTFWGGGGGGVGILGQGANGVAGLISGLSAGGGGGGSNGGTGDTGSSSETPGNGGLYGGAGGGGYNDVSAEETPTLGARGAVRIIWGAGRAFPATNTGNV
jgi:hypothetical protein